MPKRRVQFMAISFWQKHLDSIHLICADHLLIERNGCKLVATRAVAREFATDAPSLARQFGVLFVATVV